jgi:hypothetical protein
LTVEARPCLLQKIDNNEGGIEVLKKTDNINDIDIIRLGEEDTTQRRMKW